MNTKSNAILGAVVGVLMTVGTAQAQTTLTVSNWLPPKHVIPSEMIAPWAKDVEKATEGRVKIKVLAKSIGKPPAQFDVARDGRADVTFGIHGYQPGRFLLNSVTEVPFLGSDAEAISVAYWRMFERHLAAAGEHKGVKVLGLFTHGPGAIMTTKDKQINGLADLKGLKMRIGGGIVKSVTEKFGITQMFKPAPQVYEMLSRGVADGVMFPLEAIDGFKLEKTITNVTKIPGGLYNTSFFFVMNEKKFKSLSAEDQAAIDSVSGEVFSRRAGRVFQARDDTGLEKFNKAGGKMIDAPDDMVKTIRGWVDNIEGDWAAKVKEKHGLDGRALLKEMRAEVSKLESN
jgi:TRAP-type C4-dicarboxylate transport system substrate-binding protein